MIGLTMARRLAGSALVIALGLAGTAMAQQYPPAAAAPAGVTLLGAWSWDTPGQAGMDHNSVAFNPDGSYVRASRWADGTMVRYWGSFTAQPVSPTQIRLQSQTIGWLPSQMCSQAPGFPPNCGPTPHPQEMAFVVSFTSPSTIQAEGLMLYRDAAPYLLQQQVPATLMSQAAAPVQPNIQQPIMPALRPYTTPNGPGQGIAAANHRNAQDFINGNMRGCYTAPDGRLYGCEQ
jgi:hypothetical protein